MSFTCPSCDRLNLETGKLRNDRNVANPIHLGLRSVDLILGRRLGGARKWMDMFMRIF